MVDHHQVVTFTALDQVLSVAVVDLAARRILDLRAQDIDQRHLVIARVEELDVGQPSQQQGKDQQDNDLQRAHPHESFGAVHTRAENWAVKIRAAIQTNATVTTELTTMRTTVCSTCSHERASSRKKTA